MRYIDLLRETYWALSANKIRSFLTMLGIIIGIGSVIAMISVGQGAQNSIQASIESVGSNLLIIYPGAQRVAGGPPVSGGMGSAQTLTEEDALAIGEQISSVRAVAPELSRRYQVTAKGTNTNTSVVGSTPDYASVRKIEISEGSFITEQALRSSSRVAILGPTVRDTLFGEGVEAIGQTVRINKMDFKIIGITVAKGGSGFSSPDNNIYVPLTSAQRYLAGDDYVSTIYVEAIDQSSMTEAQGEIVEILRQRHKIKEGDVSDFSVLSQADIVATASSVTSTFTMLLASIAGISLVVGGIGIMNMMLTTVTERTREIGLRKAIGAEKRDITMQFLAEAIALTFLGGFFGVILGWLSSFAISYFASLASSISTFSVLLSFGVSAGIGIIFGYYPAYRAAQLNPIEALRYE